MAFKDYTLREKEIHQAMCREIPESKRTNELVLRWKQRVPKRLRGQATELINKLRKLTKRCAYVELLRHYCPVEVTTTRYPRRTKLTLTGTRSLFQTVLAEKRTAAKRPCFAGRGSSGRTQGRLRLSLQASSRRRYLFHRYGVSHGARLRILPRRTRQSHPQCILGNRRKQAHDHVLDRPLRQPPQV
ncbi:uncharacterized protein CC84DRAFT_315704 [Paraphaeosphaeria sporulosa]|uniref:Uncharacterized protein n=1 Tax=Paraphaeosphaeria sporulosa TaxID=1460663 RepID=A0A177BYX5_9PLEO|nr:uncharacterized protein CC84DRAFT_315704 [Paraphaeosphaeria sporulosa]OAG00573.1 hypothetical protein CC84DRAFT_315704 [Paraphaeosphaeria sporulosa]